MKNTKLTIKGCCCDVKMSVTMKCWCPLNMDVVFTQGSFCFKRLHFSRYDAKDFSKMD